jgi:hypothetical protein
VVAANVTSWRASAAALATVGPGQEARLPPGPAGAAAVSAARRLGWVLSPGAAEGTTALLAAAAAPDLAVRVHALEGISAAQAPRAQALSDHGGGGAALRFAHCYGWVQGPCDANADLAMAAWGWLASLGDVPAFLAGDFNLVLEGSPLAGALAMAGWRGVFAEAGPTCRPAAGQPSRVDYVFANRAAAALVLGGALRWDLGLATHAALQFDVLLAPAAPAPMALRPLPLALPAAPGWRQAAPAAEEAALGRLRPGIWAGLREPAVDAPLGEAWAGGAFTPAMIPFSNAQTTGRVVSDRPVNAILADRSIRAPTQRPLGIADVAAHLQFHLLLVLYNHRRRYFNGPRV